MLNVNSNTLIACKMTFQKEKILCAFCEKNNVSKRTNSHRCRSCAGKENIKKRKRFSMKISQLNDDKHLDGSITSRETHRTKRKMSIHSPIEEENSNYQYDFNVLLKKLVCLQSPAKKPNSYKVCGTLTERVVR